MYAKKNNYILESISLIFCNYEKFVLRVNTLTIFGPIFIKKKTHLVKSVFQTLGLVFLLRLLRFKQYLPRLANRSALIPLLHSAVGMQDAAGEKYSGIPKSGPFSLGNLYSSHSAEENKDTLQSKVLEE